MRVRYRRRARIDIENIHEYINKHNPRAATEVVARIRYAADRLGLLPYMGHVGRVPGTYEWVVVGLPTDEVAVIAVFHGAQDRGGATG